MYEEKKKASLDDSPLPKVLYNASDSENDSSGNNNDEEIFYDKNIGLYQKSGHCYSDVKSFIPQVVCLVLVALWFSDHRQNQSV